MKKPEVPGRGETPPGKSFSSGIHSRAARRLPGKEMLRIKRNKHRFSYRYPNTVPGPERNSPGKSSGNGIRSRAAAGFRNSGNSVCRTANTIPTCVHGIRRDSAQRFPDDIPRRIRCGSPGGNRIERLKRTYHRLVVFGQSTPIKKGARCQHLSTGLRKPDAAAVLRPCLSCPKAGHNKD